ncbi:MAG: hypothetical protein LDL33_05330 [Desulfomonile sp.]|nr:hypothetical protein [Desulfomonile sp.]
MERVPAEIIGMNAEAGFTGKEEIRQQQGVTVRGCEKSRGGKNLTEALRTAAILREWVVFVRLVSLAFYFAGIRLVTAAALGTLPPAEPTIGREGRAHPGRRPSDHLTDSNSSKHNN